MFLIERWVCRDHDVPLFQSHSGPQPPTRLLSFRLRNAILGFSFVAAVLARAVGSVPLHWPGQQSRLWTEGHGLPWAGTQRIDARAPYPQRALDALSARFGLPWPLPQVYERTAGCHQLIGQRFRFAILFC